MFIHERVDVRQANAEVSRESLVVARAIDDEFPEATTETVAIYVLV
jgi:hypothetical protein